MPSVRARRHNRNMRPNWFVAFPVDGRFVEGLKLPPARIRRFSPEDVHLTIAFLGSCGPEAAQRAMDVLVTRELPLPIRARLGAVVPMGRPGAYSALSALLTDGRETTEHWMAALSGPLLHAAAGRRDTRPPKAHVTVARPQRRASKEDRVSGLAWAESLDLSAERILLDRIALYTWAENRGQRLFRIVAERSLGGPPGE